MIFAQHSPKAWPSSLHRLDFFFGTVPIYVGEFGSLAILLFYARQFYHRKLNGQEEQLFLAATASFACAFFMSFSWATGRIMLVPAFPFVLALGLSRLPRGRFASIAKVFAVLVALVCVAVTAGSKMRVPYFWADWQEGDASRASVVPDFPELRGIKVTPETAVFLRRVIGDIQLHSGANDSIAEFPTMPILYTLAHRVPMTFAYVHYIDVTPDRIYRMDARTLEQNPPAVMVLLDRSEQEFREGEVNFRNGRRSSERELWHTLEALSCNYDVVDVLQTPNNNQKLEVWARQSGNANTCSPQAKHF